MKKLLMFSASVALLSFAVIEEASAQRGGGGFRGAGFSGGGFRGAGFSGGGFRGGMMGPSFRGGITGPAFRGGMGYRNVAVAPGFRGGVVGPRYVGARTAGYRVRGGPVYRHGAWGGAPYHGYRWRHRGWGWPVAAGLGVGLIAASAYYDACWRYDGWQWVNVCYAPFGYNGYYGYY
jgi:hypothetical protein